MRRFALTWLERLRRTLIDAARWSCDWSLAREAQLTAQEAAYAPIGVALGPLARPRPLPRPSGQQTIEP